MIRIDEFRPLLPALQRKAALFRGALWSCTAVPQAAHPQMGRETRHGSPVRAWMGGRWCTGVRALDRDTRTGTRIVEPQVELEQSQRFIPQQAAASGQAASATARAGAGAGSTCNHQGEQRHPRRGCRAGRGEQPAGDSQWRRRQRGDEHGPRRPQTSSSAGRSRRALRGSHAACA